MMVLTSYFLPPTSYILPPASCLLPPAACRLPPASYLPPPIADCFLQLFSAMKHEDREQQDTYGSILHHCLASAAVTGDLPHVVHMAAYVWMVVETAAVGDAVLGYLQQLVEALPRLASEGGSREQGLPPEGGSGAQGPASEGESRAQGAASDGATARMTRQGFGYMAHCTLLPPLYRFYRTQLHLLPERSVSVGKLGRVLTRYLAEPEPCPEP